MRPKPNLSPAETATRTGPTRRPHRHRRVLLGAGFASLGLLAAACGGGSTKASAPTTSAAATTTAPAAGGSSTASRAEFTSCLEAHGVPASAATTFGGGARGFRPGGAGSASGTAGTPGGTATGSPTGGPGAGAFSQYSAAFAACRSDLPSGGAFRVANSPQFAAYRNCLSAHGVTAPTGSVPSTANTSGSAPTTNAAFAAARAACAPLLPARSTTTTTTAG